MASTDDFDLIMSDLIKRDDVFDYSYQKRKDFTIADLDHNKTPEKCSSISQLVYDESTRRLWWNNVHEYKTYCLDDITKNKKPWRRWWKRKNGDHIERGFTIYGLPDFVVVSREFADKTVIQYYINDRNTRSMTNDCKGLVPTAKPFN